MVHSHTLQKKIILLGVVLILIISGWIFFTPKPLMAPSAQPPNSQNTTSQRTTLHGSVICLPLKDTSKPSDSICNLAIQTSNGNYLFDTNLMSATPPQYKVGDTIKANGVITPIENLSTNHWQNYDVKGIFSATDGFEVTSPLTSDF